MENPTDQINLGEMITLLKQHPANMKSLEISWENSCCTGEDGVTILKMPKIVVTYYEDEKE